LPSYPNELHSSFDNPVHFLQMHVKLNTKVNLRHPCNYSFADSYCFATTNDDYKTAGADKTAIYI
jgi:hypothetical protein